ncbi:hypothetical protein, partial [Paraburkholderia caribensis]|uniref:hypothetical protein n=1 Tax=Paraburkholderia caribensis TaxID=75105 RepID=UPI003F55CA7D
GCQRKTQNTDQQRPRRGGSNRMPAKNQKPAPASQTKKPPFIPPNHNSLSNPGVRNNAEEA